MMLDLPPTVANLLIALSALMLYLLFWRATRGARGLDTFIMRFGLGLLLLPFVVAAVLGSLHGHDWAKTASSPPPVETGAPRSERRVELDKAARPTPPVPQSTAERPPAPPVVLPPAAPQSTPPPAPGAAPRTAAPEAEAPPPASAEATAPAPVAPPPPATNWDVVPVYYGTDRKSEATAERPEFGSERAKRLTLGRALVTVPKSHEVPNVERPWVYRLPFTQIVLYREREDPARHFTLKEIRTLTREELAKLVRERLAASQEFKDQAIVFVHGFNTTFEAALFRTAQIAYDLKFDGAPFLYSWPSKGQIGLQDYSYDRESSGQAEPYLKEFLEFVTRETGAQSVSIIAHSMGNQLLLPVLRDLKRTAPSGVGIAQVILAAPDVDRDNFEFLAREIMGIGKGFTMLAASNDWALDASRRFWGGVPRAGDVPVGGPVIVPGIDTIDVTAISTEVLSLNHSGYAQKQQLLDDIRLLLKSGERPPEKRIPTLERITTQNGQFWRYPAPR